MSERTYAAAGWIATASVNLFALAQSESVLNAASGVTIVGGSLVGLYFLFKHKQLEIQKKEHEQNLQAEKDRQALLAGSLTGQLEATRDEVKQLTMQLRSSENVIKLKQQENETINAMFERLKAEFEARREKDRSEDRHKIRGDLNVPILDLRAELMEAQATIKTLETKNKELTKGVNKNADAIKDVAHGADASQIELAHIDDTSGDLPTLTG